MWNTKFTFNTPTIKNILLILKMCNLCKKKWGELKQLFSSWRLKYLDLFYWFTPDLTLIRLGDDAVIIDTELPVGIDGSDMIKDCKCDFSWIEVHFFIIFWIQCWFICPQSYYLFFWSKMPTIWVNIRRFASFLMSVLA